MLLSNEGIGWLKIVRVLDLSLIGAGIDECGELIRNVDDVMKENLFQYKAYISRRSPKCDTMEHERIWQTKIIFLGRSEQRFFFHK